MDIFIDSAQQLEIIRYTIVATVSLVTYEYLIKFDSEVRYLWRRRFTFAGGLLFLCRYFPFLAFSQLYVYVLTPKVNKRDCMIGLRASTCFVYIEFLLAVLVLFTRTYAVWGGTRRIFTLLAFVYAGGIAGTAYSVFLYVRGVSFLGLRIGGSGCLFLVGNDLLWIALVILIFCEGLALALLLVKSFQHAKAMKNVLRHGNSGQNILLVMAHDGLVYFACTLAITSGNLVVLKRVTPDLRDFLFVAQGAIQGILCARLLFHIHTVNEFPEGTYQSQIHTSRTAYEMTPPQQKKFGESRQTASKRSYGMSADVEVEMDSGLGRRPSTDKLRYFDFDS
ncbi:hypothetical protein SCHPADRAFT_942819 [Schizopora paradoxa]|uniref:DUF6533 domain-containing protein n=1 Tax=Schizopora paradoxa TaxID=27342 RepID=A0A0H2S0C0_9AGAM|nr:hypothetical protein SCHPADRAFT_942819 [Schizopora paradoxa]